MKRMFEVLAGTLAAAAVLVGGAVAASTPAVVTGSATSATNTTVRLHGIVNPEGSGTTYTFQWGLTNAYGLLSATHSAGAGTKPVSVATTPTALIPGTIYHYRLIAGNRFGVSLGSDRTFKTTGHPPAVVVTGLTFGLPSDSAAVVTGSINPNGEATNYAFQYGSSTNYSSQTTASGLPASTLLQAVHATIGSLSPGTTFHYRLIAIHTDTTITYGGDQTFTTLPFPRPVPGMRVDTTPFRARNKPYLFTTSGKLVPPASLPVSVTCGSSGTVAIRFFLGHRTRAFVSAQLKPDCTFFAQMLFHRLIGKGKHSTRLRVEVRFRGNPYLASSRTHVQRVHLG